MFKNMWTYRLLDLLYVVANGTLVIGALVFMADGADVVGVALATVVMVLVVRFVFEAIVIRFDMHKRLVGIEERTDRQLAIQQAILDELRRARSGQASNPPNSPDSIRSDDSA